MKINHIWQDYSPNLFDKSHPLCQLHGFNSEVVCQAFIDNGAKPLDGTYWVRKRDPSESNFVSFGARMLRRIRRPIDAISFARLVHSRIRTNSPDVMHLHFGTTASTLEQLGALPNLPMVVSFYGSDASASLRDPNILRAYRSIFKKASVLHVLCDEVQQRLVEVGCPAEKIRIANLPANLELIPDIGVEPTEITRFLMPARFVEKKGHVVLLTAFKRLLDDGHPASLTCYGYGPVEWLHRCVAELKLGQTVTIVNNQQSSNFMEEYLSLLRQHDVVLAPSIRSKTGDDEGGPALTLVMAQAAGKPVIVSDFPGSERSVTDAEQGLVVPVGDATALQKAMTVMICNHPMWQRFGRAGRKRVLNEFSEESYWTSLQDWYQDSWLGFRA